MDSYWPPVANWLHRCVRARGSGNKVMPMIEPMPSLSRRDSFLRRAKRANHLKWLLAGIMALGALMGAGSVYDDRCELSVPTEIFEGITYGCKRLDTTEEGSGLVHWVSINLATRGIELYVPPLDPVAVAQGWQYRLRRVGDVVDKENLAVAVNGALFGSDSGWWPRMAGDLANSVETVVADHVVSHLWEHAYLLGFDDQLTPFLSGSKPPTAAELARAKWGIGGQAVALRGGKVWLGSSRTPDSRTAVAIDRERKLLFLALGQYVSPRRLLQDLADLGAKEGMLLDGGDSSSMAIGEGAAGLAAGVLYGGWRPVATHFGVRAQRLRMGKHAS
jgi:Phosphodiester glycosidase